MNNKSVLAFVGAVVAFAFQAHAQTTLSGDHVITGNVGIGTTANKGNLTVTGQAGSPSAPGVTVTGDGGVLFLGTHGVGTIPMQGEGGVRFMWYPKKAALRAGEIEIDEWDDGLIGYSSTAFGYATIASGTSSFAAGSGSWASGGLSTAFGWSAASGDYSFAAGRGVEASGYAASAFGEVTSAFGSYSLAFGYRTEAIGACSLAAGNETLAVGNLSCAFGFKTVAYSQSSFVVGQYNEISLGSLGAWVGSESVFEIGNGTGNPSDPVEVRNRNALTVYKNGDVKITKRQGDILMGEFGSLE